MKRLSAIVLCASLVSTPLTAWAGDGNAKDAQQAYAESQKRFDEKDYAGALELGRKALLLTGSPNARLHVARCLKELGRLAEAYDEMVRTVNEATDRAKQEPKYIPTRDAAAAEMALLNQRVGKLVVALADPPDGASVSVNGQKLAADKVGAPITLEPGNAVVSASAPGMETIEQEVRVTAGETRTIALALKSQGSSVEIDDNPAPKPKPIDDTSSSGGSLRTWGFVTAGVGVAGFVVFGVAGSMANSKFNQLEDECGGVRCNDPKYADTVDSGKNLETIANVGLVVGAVGVLAGGAMVLFGGPKEKAGQASVAFQPGGGSFLYQRAF